MKFEQNVCLGSWKWKFARPEILQAVLQALSNLLMGVLSSLQKPRCDFTALIPFGKEGEKGANELAVAAQLVGINDINASAGLNQPIKFLDSSPTYRLVLGAPNHQSFYLSIPVRPEHIYGPGIT